MIQGGTGPEKGKGGAQAREREGRHLRQIWGGTMISPTIGHMFKLGGAGELRSTALWQHPGALWRHNVWPFGGIFSSAPLAGV